MAFADCIPDKVGHVLCLLCSWHLAVGCNLCHVLAQETMVFPKFLHLLSGGAWTPECRGLCLSGGYQVVLAWERDPGNSGRSEFSLPCVWRARSRPVCSFPGAPEGRRASASAGASPSCPRLHETLPEPLQDVKSTPKERSRMMATQRCPLPPTLCIADLTS